MIRDFLRRMPMSAPLVLILLLAWSLAPGLAAEPPSSLARPTVSFTATDRYVAASVFHWYTANGGQLTGPWRPAEGRPAWNGTPAFWQRQVKDMMDANIDVMYLHLIPSSEQQRLSLFTALSQMRAAGYDVPRVAPFLDPLITWDGRPIDLATAAGKDTLANQYIRFFNQYFQVNTDAAAESYLAHIDGKVVLDTWHLLSGYVNNATSMTRLELEGRLKTALAAAHPSFKQGIYMVCTAIFAPFNFADEVMHQFSNTEYLSTRTYSGRRVATLKGGYWDQNIRDPGIFFPRQGGAPYRQAWASLVAARNGSGSVPPIYHAYIESWNEYDEGSGIYAANPGPPYINAFNDSGNTDVWSTTNNPREYIDATHEGSSEFNGRAALGAEILWHDLPESMTPGEERTVTVIVRNAGNTHWTNASFGFAQTPTEGEPAFAVLSGGAIDPAQDEIPTYGGIFRGRPKTFTLRVKAPATEGSFTTHWRMKQGATAFGETLTQPIEISELNAARGEAWQSLR